MSPKVAFIDTETTGFGPPIVPVEIAILTPKEGATPEAIGECFEYVARFNPEKDIEYGAVAAHGIIPEDLSNSPPWSSYRPTTPDYAVGHAIDYDLGAIFGEGRVPTTIRRIDTLALSRYAFEDEDSHKLAAMMYVVFGQNAKTRARVHGSHSALVDTRNTVAICEVIARHYEIDTWEGLWRLSELARVPTHMPFGPKYGPHSPYGNKKRKGIALAELRVKDKGYVKWLLGLDDLDPYLRKALTQ